MKTADDLFPCWIAKLEHNVTIPHMRNMHMLLASKCIVGEAHKWTSDYYYNGCDICKNFADEFQLLVNEDNEIYKGKRRQYKRAKKEFVIHWNKKHEVQNK